MSAISRRKIQRRFKLAGLALQVSAVEALESVLRVEDEPAAQLDKLVEEIKRRLEREGMASVVVDLDVVRGVVAELSKNELDREQESIAIIDSFDVPLFKFDTTRKAFFQAGGSERRLHAGAAAKADIFRNRLALLHQRLMRNPLFAPPVLGSAVMGDCRASAPNYVELTQLESLVGSSGRKCLFGMLSQIEEGNYYLEDLNGKMPVDLSRTRTTAGLFTEGCIVLAEGELEDGVFHVDTMGFPPSEPRSQSLAAAGRIDFLGLPPLSAREVEQMQILEDNADDAMFVVLSDVHLDVPGVQQRLRRMFEGFNSLEESAPPLIVLMGNFISKPFGQGDGQCSAAELGDLFEGLAVLVSEFKWLLERSRFVFVPGPNDPGAPNLLPRPSIPKVFSNRFLDRLAEPGRATFTSNPCRVRFYTQEIVLFREDILSKMRRHCVLQPSETFAPTEAAPTQPNRSKPEDDVMDDTEDAGERSNTTAAASQQDAGGGVHRVQITEHLVKTLIDQSHLCPLPLEVRPLHWSFDSAMHLYPLPDMLVLADHYDQYQWTYEDCGVFNPGSFPIDGTFVVYRPASRETEFSRIE